MLQEIRIGEQQLDDFCHFHTLPCHIAASWQDFEMNHNLKINFSTDEILM